MQMCHSCGHCYIVPLLLDHAERRCSIAESCLALCDHSTASHQAPLSSAISQTSFRFTCIESVMLSNHLILCLPFSFYLLSFPVSGFFPKSQLFTSDGYRIGVSAPASVLPMNIQGGFPLGLTGLISLQSKRLSRVFSNTTVLKHKFFGAQPSLWSS